MRGAVVLHPEVTSDLARHYVKSGQPGTIIEVPLRTNAPAGELVKLKPFGVECRLLVSHWVRHTRVAHFTAEEWLKLQATVTPSSNENRTADTNAEPQQAPLPPGSHAKTQGKHRA